MTVYKSCPEGTSRPEAFYDCNTVIKNIKINQDPKVFESTRDVQ